MRKVTNEDVTKYDALVEKFIRDSVVKNFNEADRRPGFGDTSLGNSGLTLEDIRQDLRTEVVIALQKYNPDYRTEDGKPVAEITFVYRHLWNRIGQKMKRITKKQHGYGVWTNRLENVLNELDEE